MGVLALPRILVAIGVVLQAGLATTADQVVYESVGSCVCFDGPKALDLYYSNCGGFTGDSCESLCSANAECLGYDVYADNGDHKCHLWTANDNQFASGTPNGFTWNGENDGNSITSDRCGGDPPPIVGCKRKWVPVVTSTMTSTFVLTTKFLARTTTATTTTKAMTATTEAPKGFVPHAGKCNGNFLEALTGFLDECAASCSRNPRCDAFSMAGDAYCIIYGSPKPESDGSEASCYVKESAATEAPKGFIPQAGVCNGDFLEALTGFLDECAASCSRNPRCDAFSMSGNAYCITYGSPKSEVDGSEAICYVKESSTTTTTTGRSTEAPKGFIPEAGACNGDFLEALTGFLDECAASCSRKPRCDAFSMSGDAYCITYGSPKPESDGSDTICYVKESATTSEPSTTRTTTVSASRLRSTTAGKCVYIVNANTAVRFQGTGGSKLKYADYGSEDAYLDACMASCNADKKCKGFVDDTTDRHGRRCKPKKASVGYTKLRKDFHVKSGC